MSVVGDVLWEQGETEVFVPRHLAYLKGSACKRKWKVCGLC